MKKPAFILFSFLFLLPAGQASAWGFWANKKINNKAIATLPKEMQGFYSFYADYITEHAVDPDKKRYCDMYESKHHYIDLDHYCPYPCESFPRTWEDALDLYPLDTLNRYGTLPWQIIRVYHKLVEAFEDKDPDNILYFSAILGHYVADSYVPLHTVSNYNGQHTEQTGIHAFWESTIPEMFGDTYNYQTAKAIYCETAVKLVWQGILGSAQAADSVLRFENEVKDNFPKDKTYCIEENNGVFSVAYSPEFAKAYSDALNGMVEKRMRGAIYAIGCFWMSAWVDAGQPDLNKLMGKAAINEDSDGN